MNFRRSLAILAALGLPGTTALAQHHAMGSNPIPTANNPLMQANGFGTGYNNPLSQGIGFGTGYNNPLTQGVGFGTGFNNPLQQNGSLTTGAVNAATQGGRAAGNPPVNSGYGYGYGVAPVYVTNQGYGLGGWNSYPYQGYNYGGGYFDPLNQALLNGANGNPVIPVGVVVDPGGPRSDPALSAVLNGANRPSNHAARSKSSKSAKRKSSRR